MLTHEFVHTQIKQVVADVRSRDKAQDEDEPVELAGLDSLTLVEVFAELEEVLRVPLLSRIATFDGETFDELAQFIVGDTATTTPLGRL
jgi:acyl carrier protein